MRTLLPPLIAALSLATACAVQQPLASSGDPGVVGAEQLRAGDLVVAVSRSKTRNPVFRVHRAIRGRAARHSQLQQLVVSPRPVRDLAVSADGRWLALEVEEDSGARVRLLDLRHSPGASEPTEVWSSSTGCTRPGFDSRDRWMVVACPRAGRQPASVVQVDLPSLRELSLVGETDRRSPSAGVAGDLFWSERRERHTVVLRRSPGSVPFVTHDLTESIKRLWPQLDGSLLAELDRRGSARSFARLTASGVALVEAPPLLAGGTLPRDARVHVAERGTWWVATCERGPCSLRWVAPGEEGPQITLGGPATAISQVSWPQPRVSHPEDLATAPASVLSSHPSTRVAVLGVSLGMSLEDSFTVLDRLARHPYWIESRGPRNRPRGVGVGWTDEGHCIEYLADERGSVVAIELRGCASSYLSPALRPLLDRQALATDGGGLVRRFLGTEAVVKTNRGSADGRPEPVRRTELSFASPSKGYYFEARSEVLRSNRSRVLSGWVRLRLQLPGRRHATVRRP